jgi:hypothetical protein
MERAKENFVFGDLTPANLGWSCIDHEA